MVNISIIENQLIAPSEDTLNTEGLMQQILYQFKYTPIKQNSNFNHFVRIFRFKKYTICDILIITIAADMTAAEMHIMELDAQCQRIRRSIMFGKPILRSLQVQKHHFMRLKKSFSLYSYEYNDLPTGFLIRPLILLKQEDQWDYFMGQTTRVDVISQNRESFNLYMQQHQEHLESQQSSLINLKKFRYWKIACILLDYGHYPIIGFWIFDLICTLLDKSFPFKVGGMIFFTALFYSGFIGLTYLLYNSFKRCQINELQETALTIPTPVKKSDIEIVKPSLPQDIEFEELLQKKLIFTDELVAKEVPLPMTHLIEQIPSQFTEFPNFNNKTNMNISSTERIYKSNIQKSLLLLLKLKDSKMLSIQVQDLLKKTFYWILNQTSQEIPKNATLPELLKVARDNNTVKKFLNLLKLWIGKLDTQTPFTQDEISSFKKFLLEFLYELKLLPHELALIVERKLTSTTNHKNINEKPKNEQTEIEELKKKTKDLKNQKNENNIKPAENLTQVPTPSLEITSVPQNIHSEISEINVSHLQVIRKNDLNSIYCTILVDTLDANTQDILYQFNACTKDLDIKRNYIDIQWSNNKIVKQEFNGHQPPAVLIGHGLNSQVIPFNEIGDNARLHSIIKNYFQSKSQIILKEKRKNEDTNNNQKDSIINNQLVKAPSSSGASKIPHNLEKKIIPKETQLSDHSPNILLNQQQIDYIIAISTHLTFFEPGCVMVDGSNVTCLYKDYKINSGPDLDCVLQTVEAIIALGIPRDRISIYFDSNFHKYKLKDYPKEQQKFEKYKNQGIFHIVSSRTEANTAFIQRGMRLKKRFIVVSKDQFKNKPDWFRSHLVGVGLSPNNTPYLVVNSPKELIMAFYGKK
ncbi:MAG: hypothetical protein ACFFD2_00745 [Promethearchaeota archaeon]